MTLREIAAAFYAHNRGNEKPAHYCDFYEEVFAALGTERIALLELGVHSGSSLLTWHAYLKRSRIVGVDIAPMPAAIRDLVSAGGLGFVQADQADPDLAAKVLDANDGQPYDIVIDDASHQGAQTRAAFHCLFPSALRSGGYYLIEDYGTGYWPEWPDGAAIAEDADRGLGGPAAAGGLAYPSHHAGTVGVVKALIDDLNFPNRRAHGGVGCAIRRLIYLQSVMAAIKA